MDQYCFARCRLSSSSVTLPAGGWAGRRARGRSGNRHCTASQCGFVALGRHFEEEKATELAESHFAFWMSAAAVQQSQEHNWM